MDRLGILISPIEANFEDGKPFARTPHGHMYRVSPEWAARAEFQTLYLLKRDVYRPWNSQKNLQRSFIRQSNKYLMM